MAIKMKVSDNSPENRRRMIAASGAYEAETTSQNDRNRAYPSTKTATVPITKNAQFAGTGASVVFTQPMFFSPLHTPQNWQIASRRREIYQWSFIDVFENPCYLTLNNDFSLVNIKDVVNNFDKKNVVYIQNGKGEKSTVDKVARRYVNKKANKIKVLGVAEDIVVTNDHNCIVVKKEDVDCHKAWNSKKCVCDYNAPMCQSIGCSEYKNKEYEISKIKARNVKKGDYVLIPFSNEVKKSVIKSEDQARFAGHLASDGSVSDKYGEARICMNISEVKNVFPCVENVFNNFEQTANLTKCGSTNVVEARSTNKSLFKFSHSLVQGKNINKKFTTEVMLLDPKLQLHVLGAYVQSDGHYNKTNKCVEITTYSMHLANQLINMCYRCDILARVNKQPISKGKGTFDTSNKYRYIINISSSECHKIKDYVPGKIKENNFKDKGANKRFFWGNYVVSPVVSNKSFDYEGYVYDIREPKTNTIIANGIGIYQCRFYYMNEPKVAAGVDFYSNFSMNGFKLESKNKKILKYYENIVEKLDLAEKLNEISHEYFLLGDVFPFVEIGCPHCLGKGTTKAGEDCNHPDGTFKAIKILNPDYLDVSSNPIATEPEYYLIPDEELKSMIARRQPKEIFDRLPKELINLVMTGQPIHLSKRSVSHLKHNASPYGTYGISLIQRLFTYLAYKTKIMTANWIIAERLILPVRVVKVGDKDRPASEEDLQDVVVQLSAVANDPNLTVVTHHAFDYEWYGACHDAETEILTNTGWKRFYEIDENEIVATYNDKNQYLQYQQIDEYHEYDFKSTDTLKMFKFKARGVDINVTPNHRMLVERDGCMREIYSQEVKHDDKFLSTLDWRGRYPSTLPYAGSPLSHLSLDEYLEFIGYYISEGGSKEETNKNLSKDKQIQACSISQNKNSISYGSMKRSIANVYPNFSEYEDNRSPGVSCLMTINSVDIARYLAEEFGSHSWNKRIPRWIKNLPKDKLQILYDAMMAGDGFVRNDRVKPRYGYATTSKRLSDDWSEICLKLGFFTITGEEKPKNKNSRKVYRLHWSEHRKDTLFTIRKQHIKREDYEGKVYCVKVLNTWIITRRNGRITIQGNTGKIHNITQEMEQIGKEMLDGLMLNQAILNGEMSGYNSAQVGIEVLIRRLDNWRNKLKGWVEKNIFLPIAMMQGFTDKEESNILGETVFLYPRLVWNDLQLRDKTNKIQTEMQLYDKGLISAQTILEELDLDYDEEVQKIRDEQVMASASGMLMGAQGGAGNLGTMGMGAGMGGAGGAPGGDMAGGPMGDMGGGMGAPGGDMGGGMAGGMGGGMGGAPGGAPMGAAAGAENQLPQITKRGKGNQQEEEQEVPPPQMIKLTKLEQKMYKLLQSINVPYDLFGQYAIKVPGEQRPFTLDFAYPRIGVGVECLHPETYIPTPKGSIMAKDISEEESLIGRNGKPVKIVKKYINKSKGSLLNIKALGMDEIRITGNHPLLVCKPKKIRVKRNEPRITRTREYYIPDEPMFVKANDVQKGDYLVVPKNRQISNNENIKEKIYLGDYKGRVHNAHKLPDQVELNADFGWLMGIYAAEGCSSGSKTKVVTFSFHIDEVEYSDKVQELLEKIFSLPSSIKIDINSNCRIVNCCSTSLGRFLLDSFGHKAPNKKLPSWMYESSVECKESFLEAFCQGDGCIREDGTMRYISSSKKLMIDMQSLAFSIGKFAPMCISRQPGQQMCVIGQGKAYKSGGLWEMNTKLCESKYNLYECKNKAYREDDDYFYVPVRGIKEEEYEGDVINFETKGEGDSDHTYLVNNIISHNCDGEIWHKREDFELRDKARDQKLANVGWRILRFREDAVEEHVDAIGDIIRKNILEAAKDLKKANGNVEMEKFASVADYLAEVEKGNLALNIVDLPDNLGQMLLIGT